MSQATVVLDYASPNAPGSLRLPTRSILSYERTDDGGWVVLETLTGQTSALLAIAFSLTTFVMLAVSTFGQHTQRPFVVVSLLIITVGLMLVPLVINSTWRRTIVRVSQMNVELSFMAPLLKTTTMQWPAATVLSVIPARLTDGQADQSILLGELHFVVADGPLVRLLGGHPHSRLSWAADEFSRVLFPVIAAADRARDAS